VLTNTVIYLPPISVAKGGKKGRGGIKKRPERKKKKKGRKK